MSFTIACNTLLSQWLMPPAESIRQELGKYNLLQIARNEVGNRPAESNPVCSNDVQTICIDD